MLHKTPSGEPCALVSNIQKYTIHDGPGIRTSVFFKGCTLRCLWCSNPETLMPRRELGCYPAKCLSAQKCGHCIKVCPLGGSIEFDGGGILKAVRMTDNKCETCLKCAEACPPRAIKLWGEQMTLPELMKIILEDESFYRRSGGGVTLTGGEVTLQWEFAETLLRTCKEASVNTCVETALHCPRGHAEAVFRYADLIITDIKHMDSGKHKIFTGAGNELILGNIKYAAELQKKLVIRTPVLPGYNDDAIRETGAFIRAELGGQVVQYQLLPYHRLGTEKYLSLAMPYPMEEYNPPERAVWEEDLRTLADMLVSEYGIPAVAGASSKLIV